MPTSAAPDARTSAGVGSPGRARIAARTLRTDNWRQTPLGIALILGFFVVYSLVRIFMNKYYYAGDSTLGAGHAYDYLTPMYSPCITGNCVKGAADFGQWLPAVGFGIPMAILIFPILAGFRTTCYYYRKAYYRSFWFSPQACAVAEPHGKYTGERRFPLILNNSHRYFFMLASILLLVNTYDAIKAFHGKDGGFGIGLGTVIMVINVAMLWGYSLSCHAGRHILAGRINNFSKHPVRYRIWTFISRINPKHGNFAMISLFTVIITDFYIMCVSAGWISDLRFIN